MQTRWRAAARMGLALAALAATSIACESTVDEDPTPVQTFKITRAAGTPAAETATPPPATATPGAQTPGVGTIIEIAGVSSTFDTEEASAPAGSVVIRFDNRDAGVVHNMHVFRGSDADGEDIGATGLEPGPLVQDLSLTLAAGSYYYQCDAHPTTMKGTLTVN